MDSVTFLGRQVSRDQVLTALGDFDTAYANTNDYERWLDKGTYKYALEHGGRLYPCKYILSLASGLDLSEFSGGEQTNSRFRGLCFEVIDKP